VGRGMCFGRKNWGRNRKGTKDGEEGEKGQLKKKLWGGKGNLNLITGIPEFGGIVV